MTGPNKLKTASIAMAAGLAVAAGLLAGCEVDKHKEGDGEHVKVSTPFGGLQVRTDASAVGQGIGIAVYPGAELVKKEEGDSHNDTADINLAFGDFRIRVKAMTYRSSDSQDKLIAFYRKELGKY